jgi:hypothetical protein
MDTATQTLALASRTLPRPEPTAVDRKIVLSRILAVAEARRSGLEPTAEEVRETTRWWRREFGLCELEPFARWLRFSGMDLAAFQRMMWEFAALTKVLQHHGEEVDARMADHLAIHSVRTFVGEAR